MYVFAWLVTRLVMTHPRARNDFVITLGYEVRLVMLGGITRWLVMAWERYEVITRWLVMTS